jgi:hypothetical protein
VTEDAGAANHEILQSLSKPREEGEESARAVGDPSVQDLEMSTGSLLTLQQGSVRESALVRPLRVRESISTLELAWTSASPGMCFSFPNANIISPHIAVFLRTGVSF